MYNKWNEPNSIVAMLMDYDVLLGSTGTGTKVVFYLKTEEKLVEIEIFLCIGIIRTIEIKYSCRSIKKGISYKMVFVVLISFLFLFSVDSDIIIKKKKSINIFRQTTHNYTSYT